MAREFKDLSMKAEYVDQRTQHEYYDNGSNYQTVSALVGHPQNNDLFEAMYELTNLRTNAQIHWKFDHGPTKRAIEEQIEKVRQLSQSVLGYDALAEGNEPK
jgi:hypothetical protein